MGHLEQIISKDQDLVGTGRWLHGAVNDSLVVDTKEQIFFWNSRGLVGDTYVWLTKVKGLDHDSAKEYIKQLDNYSADFIQVVRNREEIVVYPKLVDLFYEEGQRNSKDYWERRGINSETINRYKLGYHDGWYCIPFFQDGLFRNFQMRREVPTKEIKSYYHSVGRLMFNAEIMKITDKIIIAEGPTDCLRLNQEGIPCVSHNAGSEGWDDRWFKYFIHQREVIVCYDNDDAGRTGAAKVAKNLGLYRTKIFTFEGQSKGFDIIDWFNNGYDIDEFLFTVDRQAKYLYQI
jgi:DNA primase